MAINDGDTEINDGDTEIARVLRSTDEEWHAHIATQGLDWDTEEANLRLFYEVPPTEVTEKALFGASLDDIMDLSEFIELEFRPVPGCTNAM
jgi:hypothetical protein